MNKYLKTAIIPFLFSALTLLLCYLMIKNEQRKTAVVDAIKLFNNYNMKKELEMEVEGRIKYLVAISDSLEKELKMYPDAEKTPEELIRSYKNLRANIDQEFEKGNRSINEQVWQRLNPLIIKYGKEKNLHLIIGANGMGTVLYNEDSYDLTDDLIKHVNREYEGK